MLVAILFVVIEFISIATLKRCVIISSSLYLIIATGISAILFDIIVDFTTEIIFSEFVFPKEDKGKEKHNIPNILIYEFILNSGCYYLVLGIMISKLFFKIHNGEINYFVILIFAIILCIYDIIMYLQMKERYGKNNAFTILYLVCYESKLLCNGLKVATFGLCVITGIAIFLEVGFVF